MAKSYDDVRQLLEELGESYRNRHQDLKRLRDYWHGRYWDRPDDSEAEREGMSILNVFRDLTSRDGGDVGPDLKLVHNLLFEVCVKHQTYLSALPMIRMYVDEPQSDHRRNQAELKERFLYGVWRATNMARVFNQNAWYLPLMGSSFVAVYPDMERNHVVALQRSPEYAFPLPSYDGRSMDAVIFQWSAPESAVMRAYPNYTPTSDLQRGRLPSLRRKQQARPNVMITEYSSGDEIACWAGTQKVKGVEHGFGFNLFKHLKFIDVPDEQFGHGAVEQIVNLVSMGNAIRSLLFQAVLENVFPHMVLENPMKAPEQIDMGVGSVIPLNEGGKAYWLNPPVQAMTTQAALLQENAQAVKEGASMPDVNFGQFRASIVTGKAINELQGAGTGSLVEMVQSVLGDGMVEWNEQAIYLQQEMFRDDVAMLNGVRPRSIADMQPQRFGLKVKGKDLIGSANNELIFSPTLDLHTKLVMNLQAMGAGLVSKQYAREQIGIPDNQAMEEEIWQETIEAAMLEGIAQGLVQAGAGEEQGAQAEAQGLGIINGTPVFPAAPASPAVGPGAPGGAPPGPGAGGPPVGPLAPGAPGQAISPALQLPPGSPPPGGAPTPGGQPPAHAGPPGAQAPTGAQGPPTLDQVVSAFQQAGLDLQGRVFLVGEIVQAGQASGPIECAVTDPDDRQTIQNGLPQFTFVFHVVPDEPSEPHIEVSPGAEGSAGGSPEALAGLLGG